MVKSHDFIQNHFYVDEGLGSVPTPQAAIEVPSSVKILLAKHNICLHQQQFNRHLLMRRTSTETCL